jgi:hypothetical protein
MSAEIIILVLALHVTVAVTVLRNPEMLAAALHRISTCHRRTQTSGLESEHENLCSRVAVTEAHVELYSDSMLITDEDCIKVFACGEGTDSDQHSVVPGKAAIDADVVTYPQAIPVLYGEVQESANSCIYTQAFCNYRRSVSCYPDFHLHN